VLKNCAYGRDPALCGFCKCSHIVEYAALSKTLHALADGLMLVFKHPADCRRSARYPSVVKNMGCLRFTLITSI
jgi:hypothetical protein